MVVCFIGHRKIDDRELVRTRLFDAVSALIAQGADTFLFGSRSEFDFLSWQVVTEFKEKYPQIKRVCYKTLHELAFTSKEKRESLEKFLSEMERQEVHLADYDEAVEPTKSYEATKDTYVIRNQEMMDDSDVCVFYFNKDYLPPPRKLSKRHLFEYQPNSGTAVAFDYATRKKKTIVNLYESVSCQ